MGWHHNALRTALPAEPHGKAGVRSSWGAQDLQFFHPYPTPNGCQLDGNKLRGDAGFVDGRQDAAASFLQGPVERRPGRQAMAAAAEPLGHLADIHRGTPAEADLHPAAWLLHEEQADLDAFDTEVSLIRSSVSCGTAPVAS